MDVFECFVASNTVKRKKSKYLHKFTSLKKSADLYGQYIPGFVLALVCFNYVYFVVFRVI